MSQYTFFNFELLEAEHISSFCIRFFFIQASLILPYKKTHPKMT